MFLQYAVWGVWLPVLATYLQSPSLEGGLGFTSGQVGWIIGVAASMGAIFAPFIAGQFADRYFPTEKFLALLLFFGGIVKIILSFPPHHPNKLTTIIKKTKKNHFSTPKAKI